METNESEVQRLLTRIEAEYEAAERGLHGLAYGTSRHDFLAACTVRIATLYARLGEAVGDKHEAMRLIACQQQPGG